MRGSLASLAAAAALPWWLGAQDTTATPVRRRSTAEDLQLFGQVLNQIRVNHPDSIDTHELLMAAIQGMVAAADPHSYVIPAVRLSPDKEALRRSGKLAWVFINFRFIGGAAVVANAQAGSKAARQDILPGDELIAIDGKPLRALSADEVDLVLSGQRGTKVELKFERRRADGSLTQITRVLEREIIEPSSAVSVSTMLNERTGYVRITTFAGEKIADDVNAALSELEKRGMTQLVLDLRDNGGGSVEEAARVAGAFLPTGTLVYTATGRKADVSAAVKVKRSFWSRARSYPMIVLVNEGTASASELVAGALQDHDRALIVGQPSFGKALLMYGLPLSDGSLIMLVVGHVRTPCGRVVQRQYRTVTRRDYYRLAGAERDTAGRPSCKSDKGRTLYGGGGIYPDEVLTRPAEPPLWLRRALEDGVIVEWLGSYMQRAQLPETAEAFTRQATITPEEVDRFVAMAAAHAIVVPADSAARSLLQRRLLSAIAYAKWGEAGAARIDAALDADLTKVLPLFDRASALMR